MLCPKCPQKCSEGLAPFFFVLAQTLEVFLEGQANLIRPAAQGHHLSGGFHHRIEGTMEGAPFRQRRIQAKGHGRSRVGFCAFHRQFCHHAFSRGQLMLATKGHQHRIAANGGVKALSQAFLTADIQILEVGKPALLQILLLRLNGRRNRS